MDIIGYAILLTTSFLASIIGGMMGMAMLILPPVMIFLGVPIHTAIATGRFAVLGISVGSIAMFSGKGMMRREYYLVFAVAGMIGSFAGASLLALIPERALYLLLGTFMILISIVMLFEEKIKKLHPAKGAITLRRHALSVGAGLLLGAYMGIIGGGAATIIIFLLVLIYGVTFHEALANQKAISLPITLVAALVFIMQGLIDYSLGIPMLLVNVAGGVIGAHLVMKLRGPWLKVILVPVTIAIGIKLIFF